MGADDPSPCLLFVYGTLLPGEPRWGLIEQSAAWAADAEVPGRLFDTGRGYPAAVFDADDQPGGSSEPPRHVPGAVVAIDPARWDEVARLLDQVEAEGVLFRRTTVGTRHGPALAYEWIRPVEHLTPLPAGWRRRGAT